MTFKQVPEKPPGSETAFQCRSRSTPMLQTTRFLLPSVVLSLTILGLAVIYNGGCLDVQVGTDNRFRIEGVEPFCEKAEPH
jgi:hypothetical protein